MTIFVDADGCPVTRLTADIAKDYNIDCVIICDTSHIIEIEGVKTITVDKGDDSADFRIANMIGENDIAVTQDYGLAAMCLSKKSLALNQNGMIYTNENIDKLLFTRHISKKIRNAGGRIKGPAKRTKEADDNFQKSLINLIEKMEE